METSEKIVKGWLKVNLLFEIMGRPKEHLIEVLNLLIKRLGEEKQVEILKDKVHEAKQVPKKDPKGQDIFSSFAEVEILVDKMSNLIGLVFDYMPSSIEIVSPSDLKMVLNDANALLNDFAMKLHSYYMTVNTLQAERDILSAKLAEIEKQSKKA